MKKFALLLASAAAALAGPLAAQDFAITNATVATGDGSDPVENATVVVRGGRVVAAGTGVAVPAGVETIDGAGSWVTPGLVATVTSLGLWDVGAVSESNDTSRARDQPQFAAHPRPPRRGRDPRGERDHARKLDLRRAGIDHRSGRGHEPDHAGARLPGRDSG